MNIIIDRFKNLNPREVRKEERFLGHRAVKNEHLAGDKRCDYCGKWFSWSTQNIEKYIVDRRWDYRRKEPIHCGSGHCWDYHMRWLKHMDKMATDIHYVESNFYERKKRHGMTEQKAIKLFETLKARGVVA